MLVIAGHLHVAPARREEFVAAHRELVERARSHPGCIEWAIGPDPFDEARVNLLEVWESEATLDAWRKASDPPATDVEFTDGAMCKYLASTSGTPFEKLEN